MSETEDIQPRIDELNAKLHDFNVKPQEKRRIANELITLNNKKMLTKADKNVKSSTNQ